MNQNFEDPTQIREENDNSKITYNDIFELRKIYYQMSEDMSWRIGSILSLSDETREKIKKYFNKKNVTFSIGCLEDGLPFENLVRTSDGNIALRIHNGTLEKERKHGYLIINEVLFEYNSKEELEELKKKYPVDFVTEIKIKPSDSDYSFQFGLRIIEKNGKIRWNKKMIEQYGEKNGKIRWNKKMIEQYGEKNLSNANEVELI